MKKTVYDFQATLLDGTTVSLDQYKGEVLLIVNTASQCGFTPQYAPLQELYNKYSDRGFRVLAFPCNQFGQQEPGSNETIGSFCESHFGVTFPVFEKVNVNGEDAHPLYAFLSEEAPGLLFTKAIKWNFTKFLVDRNGHVITRYAPTTTPQSIEPEILKLLEENAISLA